MYKFIKNHVQNVESIIIYRKRQKSEHAMNPTVNCFAPFTIFGFLFELLFVLLLEIVFTGSLIKNQLVTNHTLDIALQNVFDSLCTPADSKVCIGHNMLFLRVYLDYTSSKCKYLRECKKES